MNDKRKNFQSTFENIKSCLLELGFSGADEIIEKDSGKFLTGIQDEEFGMPIEITCKADIVNLKVSSNLVFNVPDIIPFHQLLNELNLKLMDIGHFAINEADGDVVLQTSVDLSADNFDREQMLSTIKRIVRQGLEFFNLLKKIINGDQCHFYMLHNYIEEMREKQVKDQKTIH